VRQIKAVADKDYSVHNIFNFFCKGTHFFSISKKRRRSHEAVSLILSVCPMRKNFAVSEF
jgi:hypothetical protein